MKILVYGDKNSNPTKTWFDRLPQEYEYTVYVIPTGNYINIYDLLTEHLKDSTIKQHDHVIIQNANEPNLCFYNRVWVDHFSEWESTRDNFKFYGAGNNQLLWSKGIFNTPVGDGIQKRFNTDFTRPQKDYLERLINNGEIDQVMKGSEIRLLNLLQKESISYTLIKDVNHENFDIRITG